MTTNAQAEKFEFQTEVQQLLHLMIHSLYTHKEIFLRELISNSSDACDRLRFASLTDSGLLEDDGELDIKINFDKDNKTITVTDNGIGMNREEVIENIGTIARSGTKEFVEALSGEQAKDANLIGQFGVGFYSVFMVSERVTVTTRRAGMDPSEGVRWESEGDGSYTLESVTRDGRGTEVVLKLREDESEFLENYRLRSIISKYSDHISLPIHLPKYDADDDKDDKDKEKKTDKKVKKVEWETVNKGSALWSRPRSDISEEEYNTFYSTLSYDSDPPLRVLHNRVEGNLEYITLFYIPKKAPFDLWDKERRHGVKLYVRRIFIMDDSKYLMPAYMRFIRGVVDSADLPLNVSREFLQHNKEIDKIRAGSVKKILGELKKMAEKDPDDYKAFWTEFGQVLKEGIVEDFDNRKSIAALLRFSTTKEDSEEQTVSLDEYIKRMPIKQKGIYYITAENYSAAKDSPHLEFFRKQNIEVLLLSDPIDEWLVTHLTEYEDKPLKSVAKGDLDLDDIEGEVSKKEKKEKDKEFKDVVAKFKKILDAKVKDVRLTHRLTDSPACLVADETDMGGNLERILKSVGQDAPTSKPILELNPEHPLVKGLSTESSEIEDWAHVLFDQAALSEGAPLKEPALYVRRINKLLSQDSTVKPVA